MPASRCADLLPIAPPRNRHDHHRQQVACRGDSSVQQHTIHIFVIVKLPDPLQFPTPVNCHFPLIVLPFTVPVSVSTFPLGAPDLIVMPNVPFTVPLRFPVSPNVPVSVSPETK